VTSELMAGGLRDLLAPVKIGVAHIFIQHTSASLCISENADPDVLTDMQAFLQKLVPDAGECGIRLRHVAEGPDDMASHVKSVLTSTTLTIPISDGRLALGTWQGKCLCVEGVDRLCEGIVFTLGD
jgi:secondary thiamine-phosphate synthase enzyme